MNPIIIGQAPSATSDPRRPLSGQPLRGRLLELTGLDDERFAHTFSLANVLPRYPGKAGKGDAFPRTQAARAAVRMAPVLKGRKVVALGRNVAEVLGAPRGLEFLRWHRTPAGVDLAILPHPSGINLWWNDPRNVRRARRFMRATARSAT